MDTIASVLECFSSDAILPVKNYLRVLFFRKRAAVTSVVPGDKKNDKQSSRKMGLWI